MDTVNRVMTALGYFYVTMLVVNVTWALVKNARWWRKWHYERKHGKHSYGAVEFLAGIHEMVEKAKREEKDA
jgi:hypothetical protein